MIVKLFTCFNTEMPCDINSHGNSFTINERGDMIYSYFNDIIKHDFNKNNYICLTDDILVELKNNLFDSLKPGINFSSYFSPHKIFRERYYEDVGMYLDILENLIYYKSHNSNCNIYLYCEGN